MAEKNTWDGYGEYLGVEQLLSAQRPQSTAAGNAIHDEMLFIQFHQICELWFKQILFEMDDVQARMAKNPMDENEMQPILLYLARIVEIFKQLVSMIDVLETMPPQSFIDFREYLGTSSGFQSLQFRLIETRLGLKREDRLPVFHADFDEALQPASKAAIRAAEKHPSLFEQLDTWLSRTPFVKADDYTFWNEYRTAVHSMLDAKAKLVSGNFSGDALAKEMEAIERGKAKFNAMLDPEQHAEAQGKKIWRMSWPALQASLFITLYRNEPLMHSPYRLLQILMDIDELVARWRFRHALMVQRMVGMSMGTGGSSGFEYLMQTIAKHRIFSDLFGLSTYLIPSHALPQLPNEISYKMHYRYQAGA